MSPFLCKAKQCGIDKNKRKNIRKINKTGKSRIFFASYHFLIIIKFEPGHDKSNKMNCSPSDDSGQTGTV